MFGYWLCSHYQILNHFSPAAAYSLQMGAGQVEGDLHLGVQNDWMHAVGSELCQIMTLRVYVGVYTYWVAYCPT